jgi:hypothetical protein
METESAGGKWRSPTDAEGIPVRVLIRLAYDKPIEKKAAELVEKLRKKGLVDTETCFLTGFWSGVDWARHLLGTITQDSLDYMDDKGGESNGE